MAEYPTSFRAGGKPALLVGLHHKPSQFFRHLLFRNPGDNQPFLCAGQGNIENPKLLRKRGTLDLEAKRLHWHCAETLATTMQAVTKDCPDLWGFWTACWNVAAICLLR